MRLDPDHVAEICDRLAGNPVTHLGLTGKELFHSNILAWLFQEHPEPMTEAFGDLLALDPTQQSHSVDRERLRLDLVVSLPRRRPLVVENKTFSLPDEDQLHRYSHYRWVQEQDPALVLLSLGDPGWAEFSVDTPAGPRLWQWVAYDEIGKRLRMVADHVGADFDRLLLMRYCDVIDDLVELARILTSRESDESPFHLSNSVLNPIRRIRLSDLLKVRTAAIARRIHPTEVGTGFTRGDPLMQAFGAGPTRWVGWQLQQRQFRLCAIFEDLAGPSRKQREARSREAKRLADATAWFDFTEIERVMGPRAFVPQRVRPDAYGFNRYDPDFVYRYRSVPDITQGELVELGLHYLDAAKVGPDPAALARASSSVAVSAGQGHRGADLRQKRLDLPLDLTL